MNSFIKSCLFTVGAALLFASSTFGQAGAEKGPDPKLDEKAKADPAKADAAKTDPAAAEAPKTPTPKPAAAPDPETVTLQLLDGSVITGKLTIKEIPVETQFGKLVVPVSSLRSFTPGLMSHPEVGKNLESYIRNLGSANFSERDTAQKALIKMGPDIKVELQRYVDDTDTERRTRIKAILDEFDQQADEEDAANGARVGLRKGDVVETADFTIVGRIGPSSFEVTTQYGQLTIKLSDIQRAQRLVPHVEEIRKSINIDGTAIAQRTMKNTGIKVEKGDKINISAEGTITMTPWGNQAMSSPDGAANYGWYIPNQIPAGALVGRIGTSGPVFKVGSKAAITADRSGVLNLAIGMEPNYANQIFPGQYQAKVRVEKK